MRSRRRLLLYLAILHAVFAATAVVFLRHNRIWLVAVEVFFLASAIAAVRIVRAIFEPLELLRGGVDQLRDSDFTTRFRPTGQADLDGLIAVYNGMIDRLRDERTRQEEQNAFLERVLAASPAGIIVLDFDGNIGTANPATRRLAGTELAAGAPLATAGMFGVRLAALADGESCMLGAAGGRRLKCERAHFIDRGFRRSFIVVEELTEELRRSEKAAYDKLIRMMSHEVNNTTGAVGSLLAACATYRRHIAAADRQDFEGALSVSSERLQALSTFMKRFADVVRLPAPQRSAVDVCELVEHVASVLAAEARRRDIAWEWDLERAALPVPLDRVQMEQALLNILKNALEAVGTQGTVAVRVAAETGHVRLTIHDSGPGLTPTAREHLFAPFHTTKENGQGIGLTLTREILLAHGFGFTLDNAPGGGAEFVIRMAV